METNWDMWDFCCDFFCSFIVLCGDHLHILLVCVFGVCDEWFYVLKVDDAYALTLFSCILLCLGFEP